MGHETATGRLPRLQFKSALPVEEQDGTKEHALRHTIAQRHRLNQRARRGGVTGKVCLALFQAQRLQKERMEKDSEQQCRVRRAAALVLAAIQPRQMLPEEGGFMRP